MQPPIKPCRQHSIHNLLHSPQIQSRGPGGPRVGRDGEWVGEFPAFEGGRVVCVCDKGGGCEEVGVRGWCCCEEWDGGEEDGEEEGE